MLSLLCERYKKTKIIFKRSIVSYTKASMVLNYFIPCLQGYFYYCVQLYNSTATIRLIKEQVIPSANLILPNIDYCYV